MVKSKSDPRFLRSKITKKTAESDLNDQRKEGKRERNLREIGALSPHTAVLTENSGGGEVVAFDIAHKVVINVRLPRHLLLFFFVFSMRYLVLCAAWGLCPSDK